MNSLDCAARYKLHVVYHAGEADEPNRAAPCREMVQYQGRAGRASQCSGRTWWGGPRGVDGGWGRDAEVRMAAIGIEWDASPSVDRMSQPADAQSGPRSVAASSQ